MAEYLPKTLKFASFGLLQAIWLKECKTLYFEISLTGCYRIKSISSWADGFSYRGISWNRLSHLTASGKRNV